MVRADVGARADLPQRRPAFAAAVPNEARALPRLLRTPADYVWLGPDEESGAFGEKIGKSRWLPLEKNLEKLDLTKELWGFFLLVGGFCYFDKDRKPLQGANSTSALQALVPSENTMNFVGPFLTRSSTRSKRCMRRGVWCDHPGRAAGCRLQGVWVGQSEEAVGGSRSTRMRSKYAHGNFVYLMQDGSKNFFGLIPPTEEEIEEYKAKLARASDGKRFGLKRLTTRKHGPGNGGRRSVRWIRSRKRQEAASC